MRGDEKRIVDAFAEWLESEGWTVKREVKFIDVLAERGEERLYAEAKGRTTSIGLDVDTLYGQLLRRMPNEEVGKARFAVVLPEEARKAALRVPPRVRNLLHIDIFVVAEDGRVQRIKNG
jgi:hypothetical protein